MTLLFKKIRNRFYRLCLLVLRRDGGGQIPLLRPIIAELGMIAAFDFHDVFRVIDVILHALIQRAVNRESILGRIVPIEVRAQKDQPSTISGCSEANFEAIAPPMECPARYQWRIWGNCRITSSAAPGSKIAI